MALTVRFQYQEPAPGGKVTLELKNVTGYRISVCLTPNDGFSGNFFVYIMQRMDAQDSYTDLKVWQGAGAKPVRGTLYIEGGSRRYTFKEINLNSKVTGITARERSRVVEFKYSPEFGRDVKLESELSNEGGVQAPASKLGGEYQFSIKDASENLLGFEAHQSHEEETILRFVKPRNSTNSWVVEGIRLCNERLASGGQAMPECKINFTKGTIVLKPDSLSYLLVDESYGDFLRFPLPSLPEISQEGTDIPIVARFVPKALSGKELFDHQSVPNFQANTIDNTSETATIVFSRDYFKDLKIV